MDHGFSYLNGVFSLREMCLALLRLLQSLGLLLGRQTTTDGTSLLGAQIQGQVLLVLIKKPELRSLLEVDNGEDAGDRLAQVVAVMHVEGSVSL